MNLDRLPPTHERSVRKPWLVDVHDNLLSRVAVSCFWFELDTVELTPVFSVIVQVVWHGAVHAHYNTQLSPNIIRYTPVRTRVLELHTNSLTNGKPTHRIYSWTIFASSTSAFKGSPTPIRLSWVTRLASWSSLFPSVPSGLIGRTTYLMSDVLSYTRTSTVGGTSSLNISSSIFLGLA